uniref:Uncharacterized protein n=1 Tax=Daucus carota subsp. sativus TaxID=79200 RepID=A0A166IWL9_DAUCS
MYPCACNELTGTFMVRRNFHMSVPWTFATGFHFTKLPGPPSSPSKTGSTWTTGISDLVPGDWSFLCPVTHARKPLRALLKGLTFLTRQHS